MHMLRCVSSLSLDYIYLPDANSWLLEDMSSDTEIRKLVVVPTAQLGHICHVCNAIADCIISWVDGTHHAQDPATSHFRADEALGVD